MNILVIDSQGGGIGKQMIAALKQQVIQKIDMGDRMIEIIFLAVCFFASIVGAICGIGGGVIIKPVLDSFGVLSVAAISFLSGCTVLSMTTYSVIKSKINHSGAVEKATGIPLALGAAIGGLLGKQLFSYISSLFDNKNRVGAIQAGCLLLVTLGTLIYTIYKDRIHTHEIKKISVCVVIGCFLGLSSSFLGIGGGPINLVVLYYFFSMSTKTAAENSLYIIFFSQIANLIAVILSGSLPEFSFRILLLMVVGGILGGMAGRAINKKISESAVEKLFIGLMIVMILINMYNIYKFVK